MNDLRLAGLTGLPASGVRAEPGSAGRAPADAARADLLPFDRALQRSQQQPTRAEERPRSAEPAEPRRPPQHAPERTAEQARRRESDDAAAPRTAARNDAVAARGPDKAAPKQTPTDTPATAAGDKTEDASGTDAAAPAAARPETDGAADGIGLPALATAAEPTPAPLPAPLAAALGNGGAAPAVATASPDLPLADADGGAAADSALAAAGSKTPAATKTDTAGGQSPTALHPTDGDEAQLRAPVRDRLIEDFERRYESALGRAAGALQSAPAATAPTAGAAVPAGLGAIAGSTTVAFGAVSAPLGHPAFAQDLSHRIMLFTGQQVQSAEIALTPAELGPIRVTIDVRGQEAAMQFSAAHATTRAAIEDALPRLREMLAAQGLQLTQADVGDRAPRDSGHAGREGGRGGGAAAGEAGARAAATVATAPAATARRVGLIDIRV